MSQDAWNPQQYEKFKRERSQPFFDLIELIQPVPNPEVVDLGCGTGELTAELHRKLQAKHTLGIDSSREMLKAANAFGDDGLSFECGDIETWGPLAAFDLVFSNAAFQWCTNHAGPDERPFFYPFKRVLMWARL